MLYFILPHDWGNIDDKIRSVIITKSINTDEFFVFVTYTWTSTVHVFSIQNWQVIQAILDSEYSPWQQKRQKLD